MYAHLCQDADGDAWACKWNVHIHAWIEMYVCIYLCMHTSVCVEAIVYFSAPWRRIANLLAAFLWTPCHAFTDLETKCRDSESPLSSHLLTVDKEASLLAMKWSAPVTQLSSCFTLNRWLKRHWCSWKGGSQLKKALFECSGKVMLGFHLWFSLPLVMNGVLTLQMPISKRTVLKPTFSRHWQPWPPPCNSMPADSDNY